MHYSDIRSSFNFSDSIAISTFTLLNIFPKWSQVGGAGELILRFKVLFCFSLYVGIENAR